MYLFFILGSVLMIIGSIKNLLYCLEHSKYSKFHVIESLLPIILINFYVFSAFHCSNIAWKYPSIVIFTGGCFLCLNVTRIIISSVTEIKFRILKDLHLTLPIPLTIGLLFAKKYAL
jgi:hypothetical protein